MMPVRRARLVDGLAPGIHMTARRHTLIWPDPGLSIVVRKYCDSIDFTVVPPEN